VDEDEATVNNNMAVNNMDDHIEVLEENVDDADNMDDVEMSDGNEDNGISTKSDGRGDGQAKGKCEKAETLSGTNIHTNIHTDTVTDTVTGTCNKHDTLTSNNAQSSNIDSVFTDENAGFTVPKYLLKLSERKNKRKANSPSEHDARKVRTRINYADTEEMLLTVYITGVGYDLSEEIKHRPVKYKSELEYRFGVYHSATLTKDSVRIICKTESQKAEFMYATDLLGKEVAVSEPFCLTKPKSKSKSVGSVSSAIDKKIVKGIVFGVSEDVSDDDICAETDCVHARRLTHFVDGVVVRTTTVVLSFEESRPDVVYIGLLTFRVRDYIPPPVRCKNCQSFGHRTENCHARVRCSRCAGHHTYDKCQATDDAEHKKCANCKGNHSAAYRGCPKYVEVKEALTLAVKEKKSYKEALVEVKFAQAISASLSNSADPTVSSVHDKSSASTGAHVAGQSVVQQKKSESAPVKSTVSVASQTEPELSSPFYSHVLHSLASCIYVLLSNIETPLLDKKTLQEKQLEVLNIIAELKSQDTSQFEALKTPVDKLHIGNWGSPAPSTLTVTAMVHSNPGVSD
jgi:hypothetical protein